MPTPTQAEIFAGENLLIQAPLFELATGLTWRGRYDPAFAYVVNDALLGDDNIGYKVIANTTGHPPPNVTYYTVLPAVQAETIKGILIELVQNKKVLVSWLYQWISAPLTSGSLITGRKYLIQNFHTGDDFTNVGAPSNATGVIFTATGTAPTTWTNGSILQQVNFPGNFSIQDGLFQAELLASDTVPLSDLFELRVSLSVTASMYIGTGAQTDVLCMPDVIDITPC
jgi:hypothetical protein